MKKIIIILSTLLYPVIVFSQTNIDHVNQSILLDLGIEDQRASDIQVTDDGNLLISGRQNIPSTYDAYVIKLDPDGNILWESQLITNIVLFTVEATKSIELIDSYIILVQYLS